MDIESLLVCTKCKSAPRRKSHNWCVDCYNSWHKDWRIRNNEEQKEKARESYRKNPERAKTYTRDYRKRIRAQVLGHYGGKCNCCGEESYEFLAVDHINGGGNQHRKEVGVSDSFLRWIIKNNYPEGFRILCHNCNFAIGVYGSCPHETRNAAFVKNGRVGP